MKIHPKDVESRKQLILSLVKKDRQLRYCEVGTHEGTFADFMLHVNWDLHLTVVDPWIHQDVTQDASNVSDEEHQSAYEICMGKFSQYKKKHPPVQVIRDFSLNAVKQFDDETFDFVYLDSRHDYRSVYDDISAWYPKVKRGGILAGHDYFYRNSRRNLVEVSIAVKDYFYNKEIFSTNESLPSWYVFK